MGTSVLCSATLTSDLTLLTKQGLPHPGTGHVCPPQSFLQHVLPSYTLPNNLYTVLSLSFNTISESSQAVMIQIDIVHAGVLQMN